MQVALLFTREPCCRQDEMRLRSQKNSANRVFSVQFCGKQGLFLENASATSADLSIRCDFHLNSKEFSGTIQKT